MSAPACFIAADPLAKSAGEGEGGFVCTCRKISTTSSRLWGCDRVSGVPSPLAGSPPTIKSCAGFIFVVWSRETIAHRSNKCDTAWRAVALLTRTVRSQGTPEKTEAGGGCNCGPTADRACLFSPASHDGTHLFHRALGYMGGSLLALEFLLSQVFRGLLRDTRCGAGRQDADLALDDGRTCRLFLRLFRPPLR